MRYHLRRSSVVALIVIGCLMGMLSIAVQMWQGAETRLVQLQQSSVTSSEADVSEQPEPAQRAGLFEKVALPDGSFLEFADIAPQPETPSFGEPTFDGFQVWQTSTSSGSRLVYSTERLDMCDGFEGVTVTSSGIAFSFFRSPCEAGGELITVYLDASAQIQAKQIFNSFENQVSLDVGTGSSLRSYAFQPVFSEDCRDRLPNYSNTGTQAHVEYLGIKAMNELTGKKALLHPSHISVECAKGYGDTLENPRIEVRGFEKNTLILEEPDGSELKVDVREL